MYASLQYGQIVSYWIFTSDGDRPSCPQGLHGERGKLVFKTHFQNALLSDRMQYTVYFKVHLTLECAMRAKVQFLKNYGGGGGDETEHPVDERMKSRISSCTKGGLPGHWPRKKSSRMKTYLYAMTARNLL